MANKKIKEPYPCCSKKRKISKKEKEDFKIALLGLFCGRPEFLQKYTDEYL